MSTRRQRTTCAHASATNRSCVAGVAVASDSASSLARADAAAANISRAGGDYQDGWSEFSDDLALSSPRAHALLSANIVRYQALALLAPAAAAGAEVPVVGADRCVRMNVTLPAHGVALAEFSVPGDRGA